MQDREWMDAEQPLGSTLTFRFRSLEQAG